MSTRNFVPNADEEGGIGTSLKKWLYGYFVNLAVTTINRLTITAPATSATLTIADGKTLTAEGDSIIDQDLTKDASPTHANLTLSDLSDSYVPYVSGTTFTDGSLQTDVADAVSKKHSNTLDHARQHSITSDSDHTGTLSVAMGGTGLTTLTDHSVLIGSGTSAITPIAVGADGEYLAGSTGADPAFAALNQAAVAGLKTTDSPVHVTVKLSGLTDGKIPYHASDALGLTNSPVYTNGTNVGIGTTEPNYKLDVAGSFRATGLQNQSFTNILLNGDFEIWSDGASLVPDGWDYWGAGSTLAQETTNVKSGAFSIKLTRAGTNTQITQSLLSAKGLNYWKGREVTFSMWVKTTGIANRARLIIYDGSGSNYSSYHTGGGDWELLTVTRTISATATELRVYFQISADGDYYADGAMAVEGPSALAFNDHPTDALADGLTAIGVTKNGVGIGTTEPTHKLEVIGNIKATTIKCTDLTDGKIPYHVNDALGLANSPVYTNGTNVGIGTISLTPASGTGITVDSNGHLNRQTYKVTTTYATYADADTKKGIVIATLPAKMKIVGFYADTTTVYSGGGASAVTLRVGVTAEDAAEIIADHDVKTAAATKGLADADMGTGMTRAAQIQGGYLPSWTGTTAIYATINTTDGNTNALTAGSTTFYIVTEQF